MKPIRYQSQLLFRKSYKPLWFFLFLPPPTLKGGAPSELV